MKTARELEIPVRTWVPDRIAVATVFLIMLPIAMLNGTYTGSMVEVSNTLGVYTEDITIGYYAASAGMAVSYPIVPKILGALSGKSLLLADLVLQFFLSWFCARQANIDLAHCRQLCHRISERFPDVVGHPAHQVYLQPQGCAK